MPERAQVAQATKVGGPPLLVSPEAHVKQIVEMVPELFWYFAARPWVLMRFSRQRLLTCDTPILLVPRADEEPWMGVGLLNAWALALPLSRDTALLMTDPGPIAEHTTREHVATGALDHVLQGSTKWGRVLRGLVANNARQFIYHHPDDSGYVPDDLPEPSRAEVVAPTTDFVAMGDAMRSGARHSDDGVVRSGSEGSSSEEPN